MSPWGPRQYQVESQRVTCQCPKLALVCDFTRTRGKLCMCRVCMLYTDVKTTHKLCVTCCTTLPMSSWPDSDATTVPATDEQLKQRREEVRMVARPKVKQSKSAEELQVSCPRLDRHKQSKHLLGEETAVKQPPAAKPTAVKAKPAPKENPSHTEEAPTKDEHKGNQSDPRVAKAVQECLTRASTADLSGKTPKRTPSTGTSPSPSTETVPTPKPQTTSANLSGSKSKVGSTSTCPTNGSQSSDTEDEVDEEEMAKQEAKVRAKKQAHARYMRFSRSLTSSLMSSELCF